jgi:hypothetical protein
MKRTLFGRTAPRVLNVLEPVARAAGLALAASTMFATAAMAQPQTHTIFANGGFDAVSGKPDTCSTSEWLFVINGISPSGNAPSSISVVFDTNGSTTASDVTLTFQQVFLNPKRTTAHYSIQIDSTNAGYVFDSASAQLLDGTSYNNFVLSHGSCAGTSTPPGGGTGGGGTPPPGATPELDSLALFGTGMFGLAGYAITRMRASRPRR